MRFFCFVCNSQQVQIFIIAKHIVSAISCCGVHRVIHGDIKGDNIVIHARGHAVLIDFNLAERCTKDSCTILRQRYSSLEPQPPEVKDGKLYLELSDLWALAVTCCYLLSHREGFGCSHVLRCQMLTQLLFQAKYLPRSFSRAINQGHMPPLPC